MLNAQKAKLIIAACLSFFVGTFLALYTKNLPTFGAGVLVAAYFLVEFLTMLKNSKADKYIKVTALAVNADESRAGFEPMETWRFIPVNEDGEYLDKNGKYDIFLQVKPRDREYHIGALYDKPEKEESEEKKPDGTAQESAQENPANRSADDYNYPDFCGRLYIPAAGIDVALYNNTSQDTCNRTDSAAIFPHRPEDGGSNIVADNELESLTSVAVGSTAYVSFRVAVNRGQNKDASFIPVRAPKKFISDTLRAKLTKGASVLVSGRFESGHYEKDGQKKFYDYLSAATIQHDVNGGFSEGLLMGNLTADVVTRNTQNGGTMVTFTVASNRSYQKNGNWENATSYVSCAANGKTAEFIAAHFHKGDPIMLVGVLTSNQYQNKDGQNRTSYTVWVEKASFASRKSSSQNDAVPAVTAAPAQAAPAAAPAAPAAPAVAQPSYGNYTGDDFADIDEDDLPF